MSEFLTNRVAVGDIVIYEGRRCEIIQLTDDTAMLKNLEVLGSHEWKYLKVRIAEVKG